ncbi:hypothetical protein EI94DRAFT_1047295 [Lactarius quietus]|nr:hypothetical protein EI94DRAFT_1047295 [Lactarius quietus]
MAAIHRSILRVWMRNLWAFASKYNKLWTSAHLPSYVCISFINPEMTRRIREERGLAVRVMGRCFEALVVNKLASDLKSDDRQVTDDELRLACLSALLGTKSNDMTLLLSHPGAVEFTQMVFLALDNSDLDSHSFTGEVPSDILDVIQETFGILSQSLPAERNVAMSLDLTDTLKKLSEAASSVTATMYRSVLRSWMKNLWSFAREHGESGNSVPLPSYVFIAFTNPGLTRRIREEHDLAVRVIGRCVEALVASKLAADIESRNNIPVSNDELACLSAILGTKNDDVKPLLNHPGAIEFTNMVFLALDDFYSTLETVPLDVVQETFSFLSRSLPPELNAKIRLIRMNAVMNVYDGTSSLTAEIYRSVLREWMKNLWVFTTAYNEPWNPVPLPSYVYIAFTNPEMTRRIREQRDLAAHAIGRCVEAMIVKNITVIIKSRNFPVKINKLACLECLTAILGTESNDVKLLLSHPGAIEFTTMVFLALDNFHSFALEIVPSYVLSTVQDTFVRLSRTLPPAWNGAMLLDQTDTRANASNGTQSITAETYRAFLHVWIKNLWSFTRAYNERENMESLPSSVFIAFTNPEMTRRICEERDLAVRVIGRCVEALVVNKVAEGTKSTRALVGNDDELARLITILGTKSDDIELSPGHLGAIKFTKMVFLALDNFYSFTQETVPSDILDVIQQTFGVLSLTLQPGLNAMILPAQADTLSNISDGTSSLTTEMYRNILRVWMESLWRFTIAYNESGHTAPLPSYICIAFANPEMTRRIREEHDLAVRVIGRCVEALVVSKLAADIKSRNVSASDDELACLSAILGTKSDDVKLLLRHPGAIEFTNMVFLALDDFYSFTLETMPLFVLEVVQKTFDFLSGALPGMNRERNYFSTMNTEMRPKPTDRLIGVSQSTSSLTAAMYKSVLRVWMKNLWYFTRKHDELGNSMPSPSYVCIAFTNPEMTRRMHEECDLAVRVIGRCIEALVIQRLTIDIKSRDVLVNKDDEMACLSAILGIESHEASLCLGQPGTIELVNLASLALGDVSSLRADQMPPDTRSVLQQTFISLSHTLPTQDAGLPQDQMVVLVSIDDKYERVIVARLNGLLQMCVSGISSLTEEVRTSHLRMCLKTLWHCAKVYHHDQISDPLPSYFPLVLARPEITQYILTEKDITIRITGCCFGALIASKLVDALEPPISLSGPKRDAEMACISAILGTGVTGHHDGLLSPYQLHLINFRNVVSLISSEIDTLFTSEGRPADLLIIAQDTLYVIANSLRDSVFVLGGLPKDQGRLLQEMYSDVEHALSSEQLKDETLKTLERLREILGKLLPVVEYSRGPAGEALLISLTNLQ